MEIVLFSIGALVALPAAIGAVASRKSSTRALLLVVALVGVALWLGLLAAPLLAGALLTSGVLAALALAAVDREARSPSAPARGVRFGMLLGVAAAGYLAIVCALALLRLPASALPASGARFESGATLGAALLEGGSAVALLIGAAILAATAAVVAASKRSKRGEGGAETEGAGGAS